MKKTLQDLGVSGTVFELRFPNASNGFVVSQSLGFRMIGDNGFHTGVRLGDKVFDPIHPEGLPVAEWIEDFVDSSFNTASPVRLVKTEPF